VNGCAPLPELVARPIRADDRERLLRLFERLSPETVYRRFFTLFPAPPPGVLRYLATAGDHDHERLAALDGDEIVAVAGWDRPVHDGDEAEVAVLVEDAWQHRGVGRTLVHMLTADAAREGISVLTATVLTDNHPARRLAVGMARPERVAIDGPETSFTFRLAS
jgi:GNAT superfamily N-acetyltransferase